MGHVIPVRLTFTQYASQCPVLYQFQEEMLPFKESKSKILPISLSENLVLKLLMLSKIWIVYTRALPLDKN